MAKRRGLLLAGGTGSRLHPLTARTNKHLLPVAGKPMIYYPLAALMQLGIRDIAVLTTARDIHAVRELVADGAQWGVRLDILIQDEPRGIADAYLVAVRYLSGAPSCLILGDNLLYGPGLDLAAQQALLQVEGADIFGCPVDNGSEYGIARLDDRGTVTDLIEKPPATTGALAIAGLYLCDGTAAERAATLRPSARGELEILDLLRTYLVQQRLRLRHLDTDDVWIDMGTHERLAAASHRVDQIQARTGRQLACLEEIALQKRWITISELQNHRAWFAASDYGDYVRSLAARPPK